MIDDIDWIAMTDWGEARGEIFEGKLAVAYAIVNRMEQKNQSAAMTVLAPFQFSFWNTNDPSRPKIAPNMTDAAWRDCYKAASLAYFHAVSDPTRGSTSYLNPHVCTPQQKKNAGYAPNLVRVSIGNHDFFIAL